jgi:RNA polymerase sigma-70 factor (ECF subfamily)
VRGKIRRDPEKQAFDRELRHAIGSALAALPESYRAVFTLRAIDELGVVEAADLLGISGGCVKTRLHRARRFLQKRLHGCAGRSLGAQMLPVEA